MHARSRACHGDVEVAGNIVYSVREQVAPDYVFEPDCKLMTVEELGRFVGKEKHLPNIPNAAEIREKGLNLSEFQMKLLEKIEELTLYTVEQAKTIKVQQEQLLTLKEMVGRLTNQK